MLTKEHLLHSFCFAVCLKHQHFCVIGHHCNLLKHNCRLNRRFRILTPSKRTVWMNECGVHLLCTYILNRFKNYSSCFLFIRALYFFLCHFACAGDCCTKIVRVCCAIRCNASACPRWMGMGYTADFWVRLVHFKVGWSIWWGLKCSLNNTSVQIHNRKHIGGKLIILNAWWFNYHKTAFTVNAAYITPSKGNQIVLHEHHICLVNLFFKLF